MNEQQYRQVVENTQGGRVGWARIGNLTEGVVGAAVRSLRRRELAVEAWERVAPREYQDVTRVDAVEDGIAVIAVADRAAFESLRREATRLGTELVREHPGVRGVRFVPESDNRSSGGEREQ